MNRKVQRLKYLLSDFLAGALSWALFYFFRKVIIEPSKFGYRIPVETDNKFWVSLILIPTFWLIMHYFSGYYKTPFRKSRLQELGKTFLISLFGTLVLFFVLILDDTVKDFNSYYFSFGVLFTLQFFLTYIPRLLITSRTNHKIHTGKLGFNTLLIGGNGRALKIYKDLTAGKRTSGNKIIGYININTNPTDPLNQYIPQLGKLENVTEIIREKKVEEVIIAMEPGDHQMIGQIINKLKESMVIIKAIPSTYEILAGRVKMSSVYGTPLIEISHELIPVWQETLKNFLDFFVSIFALIITLPLTITLAGIIKLSSSGPVIYTQERIGRYGKSFKLFKFRTMYQDAEENGPALTSADDPRITPIGSFMRKVRLDEIPNFVNVLLGEMSLVGPRPERQFYIDQIMEKAPQYIHMQKVKPGITSWGQVKYGYAANVDEMVERLTYDLIYIENMSFYVDLKILIHTVLTIVGGRGK
jgi:exopolysaccharide biosynthesis polyprenyl glycosylphosphotransferase